MTNRGIYGMEMLDIPGNKIDENEIYEIKCSREIDMFKYSILKIENLHYWINVFDL